MRISRINEPHVFITMGDPSGIGPEIIMKSMASPSLEGLAIFVVIGDGGTMEAAAKKFWGGKISITSLREQREKCSFLPDVLNVVDPGGEIGEILPGNPTDEGAQKALDSLSAAVELVQKSSGRYPSALVTAPVSKERIASRSPGFIGHTEYFQEAFSSELVTMVMVGRNLTVVPVTRHIPIKDVAGVLTEGLIEKTLLQVIENRVIISGKEEVKIGVCALNPHGGEGGKIGTEEEDVIAPAVRAAKNIYTNIEGPMSADVMFYKAVKGGFDIVLAMYHDQGLAPFKMVDFDNGVNMTLGLNVVRTSPDHGTAFDIAGKGIASSESMEAAIKLAVRAVSQDT